MRKSISFLFFIIIFVSAKAQFSCNTLIFDLEGYQQFHCSNAEPNALNDSIFNFAPQVNVQGGVFSGDGMVGNIFYPALAQIGQNIITYTITDDFGVECSLTQNVYVDEVPVSASILPMDTAYCVNDNPFELVGSVPNSDPFVSWVVDNSIILSGGVFNPQLFTIGTHTVTYSYFVAANGCTDIDEIEITIVEPVDVIFDPQPNTYCIDEAPIALNASPAGGIFKGAGVVGNTFDPSLAGVGSHQIIYDYTDEFGACSNSDTAIIEVTNGIDITFSRMGTNCANEPDTLTYTGVDLDESAELIWNVSGGVIEETDTKETILVTWDAPGTYDISLEVISTPCNSGVSQILPISKDWVEISTIDDLTLNSLEEVDLFTTLDATNPDNITITWFPSETLTCNDCLEPIARPTETTSYVVVASEAFGCVSTDTVTITLDVPVGVRIPSAFSPNNDGNNDVLRAFGDNVVDFSLQIFDRWGNNVFTSTDINMGWDGTYNGNPLNVGVFAYTLQATYFDGTFDTKQGAITLIR